MTLDRPHSDTVGRVANKVKPPSTLTSTFRNISLLTHFLRQRFLICSFKEIPFTCRFNCFCRTFCSFFFVSMLILWLEISNVKCQGWEGRGWGCCMLKVTNYNEYKSKLKENSTTYRNFLRLLRFRNLFLRRIVSECQYNYFCIDIR